MRVMSLVFQEPLLVSFVVFCRFPGTLLLSFVRLEASMLLIHVLQAANYLASQS